MISPEIPPNEKQRQKAVEKYRLLDSLSEESYDNLTDLMAYITETPISLITLLDNDRNFLKSHHGVPFNESPRALSFCGHAINSDDEITIIEDARLDERFHDNPIVDEHSAIFYAGVPLVDPDGYKLGTLCVYDVKPRKLNDGQKKALISISKQVISLFEQRYQNLQLQELQDKLSKRNEDLQKFASIVSHDLKSPLANIISLTELIENESRDKLNKDALEYLKYLKTSSNSLREYIDGLLIFYKSDEILKNSRQEIRFEELMTELKKLAIPDRQNIVFKHSNTIDKINVNKTAVIQILMNLATNAIKYNAKPVIEISILLEELEDHYKFYVQDNGNGIAKEHFDNIFDLFSIVGISDRDGNIGTGIGLATVKRMVVGQGGDISVTSEERIGSTFSFTIGKA